MAKWQLYALKGTELKNSDLQSYMAHQGFQNNYPTDARLQALKDSLAGPTQTNPSVDVQTMAFDVIDRLLFSLENNTCCNPSSGVEAQSNKVQDKFSGKRPSSCWC